MIENYFTSFGHMLPLTLKWQKRKIFAIIQYIWFYFKYALILYIFYIYFVWIYFDISVFLGGVGAGMGIIR